ncbi:MAG: hypothetical protein BECKG1743F_GA0114225_100511, partial [Candidatus Kentron sp. G]
MLIYSHGNSAFSLPNFMTYRAPLWDTIWGGENRGFFSGLPRRIRIAFLFLQEMSKEGNGTRFT